MPTRRSRAGNRILFAVSNSTRSVERDAAAIRTLESRNAPQQHRFARAGGSEHAQRCIARRERHVEREFRQLLLDLNFERHVSACPIGAPLRMRPVIESAEKRERNRHIRQRTKPARVECRPLPRRNRSRCGIVAVLPGILPASISVAPNSPSARANERIVPASTPGHASGSATARNTRHSEAPSVRAASRNRESTCSSAARAVRYISGNATTAAAITVPAMKRRPSRRVVAGVSRAVHCARRAAAEKIQLR